ncbi:FtsX-like permease family protein, partial [Gemmatimonadota bacterium]
RMVAGDYFQVLGVDLVQGRYLGPEDRADSDPVCVVNEFVQERDFPGENPVGKVIYVAGGPRTIVGVVENTPHDPFGVESPKVYIPHTQFADDRNWAMIQLVSLRGDPASMVSRIRAELRAVDPNLVLFRVGTMEELLDDSVSRQRFSMLLMGGFAAMALTLAALGIYGVLSYLVSQRGHEIGIRMALGAGPGEVRRQVVAHGMTLAGAGIALGVLAALYLSRWLQSLVFQVQVTDPWVFAAVVLALAGTALAAAYLPARRATRVDPVVAFRGE